MPLNPQLKNDMIHTFSRLMGGTDQIRAFLESTQINTMQMKLEGTAFMVWSNVINIVDNNRQVKLVIDEFRKQQPNNEKLKQLEQEFLFGNDQRFSIIAKAIKNGQCILFLGPDVLKCSLDNGVPYSLALAREFAVALRQEGIPYDEGLEDDMKYMSQRFQAKSLYIAGETGRKAQEFYNSLEQNGSILTDVYRKLAQLRFSLIINTNPDSLMFNELTEAKAVRRYYNLSNSGMPSQQEAEENRNDAFWKNKTIVYNIFGSFERPQSILFTEANFVNFAKCVFQKNPPLFDRVSAEFDDEKYYLFLGFEFNQWHLKILFEIFNLIRHEQRSISVYMDKSLHDQTLDYFEREFKFFFCNEGIIPMVNALIRLQNDI